MGASIRFMNTNTTNDSDRTSMRTQDGLWEYEHDLLGQLIRTPYLDAQQSLMFRMWT